MALKTVRATNVPTAGFRTVVYRDSRGHTWDAKVLGPGTVSGLKLELVSLRTARTSRIVDDVGPATTIKATGKHFSFWSS